MSTVKTTNLTLKQRRKMQGIAMPDEGSERSDKRLSRSLALLIFLLAFGVGMALGMIYFRTDPRIEELREMDALEAMAGRDMPEDVREMFHDNRETIMSQIPNSEHRWGRGLSQFFNLPPAEQLARIKEHVERELRWEQRMAQEQQQAAANGNGSQSGDNGNGNNGNGSNGNNGRHHHGGSDTQRMQHMEQRLASSPPEQRAQFGLMHQMHNAVRQQMGH